MTLVAPPGTCSRPTVPTRVGASAAAALHRQDDLSGGSGRIMTQAHRHRTGVPGLSGDRHPEPTAARYCGDDAERQTFLQQHGPLLDMHLQIGGEVLAAAAQARECRPG